MPLPFESRLEDRYVRYLLGLLSEEETARLDEMSVVDDEVASRLRVVEDDLVDAYASGTLTGETLERFESFYLSSPRRREKVTFARTFRRAVDRDRAPQSRGAPSLRAVVRRSRTSWKLASVAALMLLSIGGLLFQEMRLRNALTDARNESAAFDRRTHELELQLRDQRAANLEAVQKLERTPPAAEIRTLAALVLMPQTRATGPIATLAVPLGTDRVTLELRLESNDFAEYEVVLKDPAANHSFWRSGRVVPKSPGDGPTVSIAIPANLLKPQHYSLELIGLSRAGRSDVLGSYALQIVRR
jgi:hypothetical protein